MADSPPSRPIRVLAALNTRERAAFFPCDPLERRLPTGIEVRWQEPAGATAWGDDLTAWQPDAILGAWSTPALPVPADGGLPVRYYCHLAGSVRRQVPRELLLRGLQVTNWGNSASRYVAEAALTLILASLRRLPRHHAALGPGGGWRAPDFLGGSLFQRRVGLHGFGATAREFVKLIAPFQTQLQAFDPYVDPAAMRHQGVTPADRLETLFAESDVLVEFCALTEATRGSVTADLLDRLPPGALWVNVARGELVDEAALIERLRAGRIRAALDVFAHEPLPPDSPLRGLPEALLTPHVAGATPGSRAASATLAVGNLIRFFHGAPLEDRIDLAQYERMT